MVNVSQVFSHFSPGKPVRNKKFYRGFGDAIDRVVVGIESRFNYVTPPSSITAIQFRSPIKREYGSKL